MTGSGIGEGMLHGLDSLFRNGDDLGRFEGMELHVYGAYISKGSAVKRVFCRMIQCELRSRSDECGYVWVGHVIAACI